MPLGKGDRQPRRHLGCGTRVWVEGLGVAELINYIYKNGMFGAEPSSVTVSHGGNDTDVPWDIVWELIYMIEEEP